MNFWIYALTLLASVGFYNYHNMLSMVMTRALFYSLTMIGLVIALTERNASLRGITYPRGPYWTMLICMSLSALVANIRHNQPLITCIIATIPYIFAYLWFYILMRLRVQVSKILKLMFVCAGISVIVFFANTLTYPNNMFGIPLTEDLSRGIQRIPVVFLHMFPLLLLYAIYRYKQEHKLKWIAVISICTLIIVLSVIRQMILLTAVFALLFYMKGRSLGAKLSTIVILVGSLVIILPHIPIYSDMMELTEKQVDNSSSNEEDIRIQAWRYYTYESWDNPITPILGNGIPSIGVSRYGNLFEANVNATKCIAEDVGWAGYSWYFGIIATIALVLLMLKGITYHVPEHKQYLSYWMAMYIILPIASAPNLYFYEMLIISTVLYMIFTPNDQTDSPVDNEIETDHRLTF